MASGEAEPLQYTTTALRVSIHCEGCKKKVKKVLHSIEGVYKVTVDAAQHKVTITGNVEADALLRRLHKAGKQAALWPTPAPAPMAPVPEAKKPEEAAPAAAALAEAAGESSAKDASDAKPKDAEAKEKPPEKGDGKEKRPDKDKNAEKGDAAAKPSMDAKASTEPKETKKGSPETAKQDAAEEASADEPSGGGKKGKKNKKNKPKDGDEGEASPPAPSAPEKKPHQPLVPVPSPGPERPPHGAFPYYAQPVLGYNVAHPSSSVSYYAPTPGVPMHPMPPPPPPPQAVPYGYPPYPAMVPVPAEFLYGPPGMRSSPPQESYNNMFNEDNSNLCSLM